MKVKVNYTVDLKEVPILVQGILSSIKRDVSDHISRLVFNPGNFEKMVADFQDFREKLDVVDSQLEDMINITAGWLQAVSPDDPEPEKTGAEAEDEARPVAEEEEIVDEEGI